MPSHTATVTPIAEAGRQGRRRARTRAELLRAAKQLLATKGFHATKIADIAGAADVGVGTFYLYFPTKEAVFTELVKETAERAKEEINRAEAVATDPMARARIGMETFVRFADANREVFRILFGHSAQFDALLHDVHQIFIADIEENVAAGMAAGVFAPVRPALAAQAVVGTLTQILHWWMDHEDIPISEIIDTTHRLLINGMAVKEA
jgi:AcrR family transcriptional regulator